MRRAVGGTWPRRLGSLHPLHLGAALLAMAVVSSFALPSGAPPDASVSAVSLFIGDSHIRGAVGTLEQHLVDRPAGQATVFNAFGGTGVKDSAYFASRVSGARAVTGGFDVIVVGLGTNDSIPDQFTEDLAARIDEIVASCGDAPVLWLTLPVTMRDRAAGAARFNRALSTAAERLPNLTLVDFGAVWDQHPEYFAGDGLHLSDEGQEAFADAITGAIDEAVTS